VIGERLIGERSSMHSNSFQNTKASVQIVSL
jgi:hypothetical protein